MTSTTEHHHINSSTDPLQMILAAIADTATGVSEVKGLLADLKDNDIAYVKARIDKQWLAIDDIEKRKADRTDISALENRLERSVDLRIGRFSDDIVRIEQLSESTAAAFTSMSARLTGLEKDTSKIDGISRVVTRLNRQSWQMAGAAAATGVLGVTLGFFLKIIVHSQWLDQLFK